MTDHLGKVNTNCKKMASSNMNLAHLDRGVENYKLTLCNEKMEDDVSEDAYSTASDFTTFLNPHLDLHSLLYLRSTQGEIAVESFSIDSIPLTASRLESIDVYMTIPPDSAAMNFKIGIPKTKENNDRPLQIQLVDIATDDPQVLVDRLNELVFHETMSNFAIMRYCTLAFDLDVFRDNVLAKFQKGDVNLLHRYLNIAFYVRSQVHFTLKELLDRSLDGASPMRTEPVFAENVNNLWSYKDSIGTLDKAAETKVLKISENLKPIADREASRTKLIDFDKFYGVNLKSVSSTIVDSIRTNVVSYLETLDLLTENDHGVQVIDPTKIVNVKGYLVSNRAMIEYAQLARNMLGLQEQNLDKKKPREELLFESRIISLILDDTKAKCYWHFAKKYFLPSDGAHITIIIPPHLSYCLGGRAGRQVRLGPISLFTPDISHPRLGEDIVSENQRLCSNLRLQPRLIHICSDLISSRNRNERLRKSKYADHDVIYTFDMSETQISKRFLFQQHENPRAYHRIADVHNVLNAFRICLVDECYQLLKFAPRTICSITLVIRPVSFESL